MERLEDGLDRGWISGELRKPIEEDEDLDIKELSVMPGARSRHVRSRIRALTARRVQDQRMCCGR
jgi:hypothetical protein